MAKEKAWKISDMHNGFYQVEHIPTGNKWNLYIQEFVYGQIHFNSIVDRFPNYIHKELWDMASKRGNGKGWKLCIKEEEIKNGNSVCIK